MDGMEMLKKKNKKIDLFVLKAFRFSLIKLVFNNSRGYSDAKKRKSFDVLLSLGLL